MEQSQLCKMLARIPRQPIDLMTRKEEKKGVECSIPRRLGLLRGPELEECRWSADTAHPHTLDDSGQVTNTDDQNFDDLYGKVLPAANRGACRQSMHW